MTQNDSSDRSGRPTMRDVSHTPPTGDRELNTVFARGPRVMTDGGERTDGSRSTAERGSDGDERPEDDDTERMKDVSHTPPAEDREVDRVFARGHERLASDADERAPGEVAEE